MFKHQISIYPCTSLRYNSHGRIATYSYLIMTRTGIFFHYQTGERLKDFPLAIGDILNKEGVIYYDALYPKKLAQSVEPIGDELLLIVHSTHMIERIKKLFPETVCILLTGFADTDNVSRALKNRTVARLLSKPFTPSEIRAGINDALTLFKKKPGPENMPDD